MINSHQKNQTKNQMTAQIYLASQSPRRAELLSQLHIKFLSLSLNVPEVCAPNESPQDYVLRVAQEKALAGWLSPHRLLNIPVLGADTTVVVDEKILGKPLNSQESVNMLKILSGRKHQVLSAAVLVKDKKIMSRLSISTVTFRVITQEEIMAYVKTKEPIDKAGGYAIQGLAAAFVSHLEGSYSGVVGLPLYETADLLNEFEIHLLK
jgi:septum formation protein